jgi:lipopolysaccharide transport system permease protein
MASPSTQKDNVTLTAIRPNRSVFSLRLKDVWEYRELIYFLVWRDVKVRYKQTAIGAAWVVLQPLVMMIIFSTVFGVLIKVPSEGLPYPVFFYTALVPWSYFADATTRGGASLVASKDLISKVYFPRLAVPIASVISPVIDFIFSFFVLLGLLTWFNIKPTWAIMTLPLLFVFSATTALAVSLWFSALNVRYRDVGYTIPVLIQLWMFASPIIYPISIIPPKWQPLYSINPMVSVISGFRWALLGKESPDFVMLGISIAVVLVLLTGGVIYFRRMERTFADVI